VCVCVCVCVCICVCVCVSVRVHMYRIAFSISRVISQFLHQKRALSKYIFAAKSTLSVFLLKTWVHLFSKILAFLKTLVLFYILASACNLL
jgi:hypothetical protein